MNDDSALLKHVENGDEDRGELSDASSTFSFDDEDLAEIDRLEGAYLLTTRQEKGREEGESRGRHDLFQEKGHSPRDSSERSKRSEREMRMEKRQKAKIDREIENQKKLLDLVYDLRGSKHKNEIERSLDCKNKKERKERKRRYGERSSSTLRDRESKGSASPKEKSEGGPKKSKSVVESLLPSYENICTICCDGEEDTTLHPCGHVYCNKCCRRFSKCPVCRVKITRLSTGRNDPPSAESKFVPPERDKKEKRKISFKKPSSKKFSTKKAAPKQSILRFFGSGRESKNPRQSSSSAAGGSREEPIVI